MFTPIASRLTIPVGDTVPRGRLVGALVKGEDRAAIERILVLAPDLVLEGEVELLTHADLDPTASPDARANERQHRLGQLRAGKLKRYVVLADTPLGQRIVKIAEINSIGNVLLGLLASSVSRKEHAFHLHAEEVGVAATHTLGFLEWRSGVHMVRACQVQSLLPDDAQSLDTFLAAQLEAYGDAALERLAEALAHTHRVPFFHADLKGFHAFVHDVAQPPAGAATYSLRWIDLARVAFGLSRRQRIINLYQALRFVVPDRSDAQERFMNAYCRLAGWYADDPKRALRKVRRFLEHKLRTHPQP